MANKLIYRLFIAGAVVLLLGSCTPFKQTVREVHVDLPDRFQPSSDTASRMKQYSWRAYFADPYLIALIDSALQKNQELNILSQEIEISRNEIKARRGEYLPFVSLGLAGGLEKEGRYTRKGAVDEQLTIKDGAPFPDPLGDVGLGAYASWELDIWGKLRNAQKSAVASYLAGVEGQHFMVTQLIAEIAERYYELMALDNLLAILNQNIEIQSNALKVVKQQKMAAKVTQLAVNRFEAQLLNTINLQYETKQRIVETENRLNFLTARYPTAIPRDSPSFMQIAIDSVPLGLPSQLLAQRPDIRQAEQLLLAAKLDVKVAKAQFYPRTNISAGAGFQAFNPAFLLLPESMLYNFAGDLVAPLINRNAIKAAYFSANAQQLQAVYHYEQTVLTAYLDVINQLAVMENYANSYATKSQEVEILKRSILIANSLFYSARADYGEVLLTQREALEAKIDLIEIKMKQLNGKINLYRSLGGGWE